MRVGVLGAKGKVGATMVRAVDAGFVQLARSFQGAWPYLELIAGATGIPDPLDYRVVEAYWVGNRLLDAVPLRAVGDSMEERFRSRVGSQFGLLAERVLATMREAGLTDVTVNGHGRSRFGGYTYYQATR